MNNSKQPSENQDPSEVKVGDKYVETGDIAKVIYEGVWTVKDVNEKTGSVDLVSGTGILTARTIRQLLLGPQESNMQKVG